MAGVRLLVKIIDELRKVAAGLQPRCAPVPLDIDGMGEVGHLTREHGIYINSAYRRGVRAALRDYSRYELIARDVSNGIAGVDDFAPVLSRMQTRRDVAGSIRSLQGAITSWAGITAAQAAGKGAVIPYRKTSAVSASQWITDFRGAGYPGAAAPSNIPGGDRCSSSTTGAMPIGVMPIGAGDHLYMTNSAISVELATLGANVIVMWVDVLVAASNISATSATSQAISTTSLARWTTGEGVCMTMDVTTNLGATAATITISYTDQANNAGASTGAISLTTGAVAGRLVPIQDGPMIRLAADDYGVRTVEGCILSASMLAGVLGVMLYKPLRLQTALGGLPVEMTTPVQAGRMSRITDAAGGTLPCITTHRLNSVSGQLAGFAEFVWG